MYRENALDTVFEKVAVQKVVSVFVVDNFMVGEAVFHVILVPNILGGYHIASLQVQSILPPWKISLDYIIIIISPACISFTRAVVTNYLTLA